jgi:transketolase
MSSVLSSPPPLATLQEQGRQLRQAILEMIYIAQSGHPGSSLSCIDILQVLWLGGVMQHRAAEPDWVERDRFVLSKGHAAPALYAVLMEAGYIPKSEINTLRQVHSNLQGHPASKYINGVDVSTGSLGQGLSAAVGMALGLRLNHSASHVYTLIGDGESQEGQIWEAALSAAGHKLSNLTAICDRNKLQIDGDTETIKALGDMNHKFRSFGWHVLEIDGHDFGQIYGALSEAKRYGQQNKQPVLILANTVKGKGISFMENQAGWHGKAPNTEQYQAALAELTPETYQQPLKGE